MKIIGAALLGSALLLGGATGAEATPTFLITVDHNSLNGGPAPQTYTSQTGLEVGQPGDPAFGILAGGLARIYSVSDSQNGYQAVTAIIYDQVTIHLSEGGRGIFEGTVHLAGRFDLSGQSQSYCYSAATSNGSLSMKFDNGAGFGTDFFQQLYDTSCPGDPPSYVDGNLQTISGPYHGSFIYNAKIAVPFFSDAPLLFKIYSFCGASSDPGMHATCDLSHSAVWRGVSLVTDSNSNVVPVGQYTAKTLSGFDFLKGAVDPTNVPEPAALALLGLGAAVLAAARRR